MTETDRWAGVDAWDRCVLSLPLADGSGLATTLPDRARLDPAVRGFMAESSWEDTRLTGILSAVPPDLARLFAEAIGWALTIPMGAIRRFGDYLAAVNDVAPGLTLRAGVGWAIVAGHHVGTDYDALTMGLSMDAARAKPVVAPWVAAGLAETGWVYAAAGYTAAEALAGLEAQTVTEQDARALAALRGVPLPF